MTTSKRVSDDFKSGLYRHFKGGEYVAVYLVTHHDVA